MFSHHLMRIKYEESNNNQVLHLSIYLLQNDAFSIRASPTAPVKRNNTRLFKEDEDDEEDNHEEKEEEEEIDPELKSLISRVLRRRRMVKFISSATPIITLLLIIAGFISALILPTHLLSRGTYISENAIFNPVNTYWGWSQVHKADKYADRVDLWRTLPSNQRAEEMRLAFESMGLPSQTQTYSKGGDVNVRGVASVLALADYLIS
ncbi:hypothetical protein DFH28DRAFT_1174622 [Melampsora americana]|nr:hypothetical protein DFH28DRAFT_1174622 [Melampsora americana]